MVLVLDLPVVASATDPGLVLEVVGIDILDPVGAGDPCLRVSDGTRYRLPDPLRDWAWTMLTVHQHRVAADEVPAFPCRVEFGVLAGRPYADVLSGDE